VVQGYFLSSYSARKLGLKTTGHAGGSQNLVMTSRKTRPGDNLDRMLAKLGRGLFVTELMGQGVNYVTGDYSRGAAGYWVEDGRIAYPVHEVTIAGTCARCSRASRHRGRRLHPGQQDGGLGAHRPHEARRRRRLTGLARPSLCPAGVLRAGYGAYPDFSFLLAGRNTLPGTLFVQACTIAVRAGKPARVGLWPTPRIPRPLNFRSPGSSTFWI
jgi:hypothetical protein